MERQHLCDGCGSASGQPCLMQVAEKVLVLGFEHDALHAFDGRGEFIVGRY